jgi:hypothetical protein
MCDTCFELPVVPYISQRSANIPARSSLARGARIRANSAVDCKPEKIVLEGTAIPPAAEAGTLLKFCSWLVCAALNCTAGASPNVVDGVRKAPRWPCARSTNLKGKQLSDRRYYPAERRADSLCRHVGCTSIRPVAWYCRANPQSRRAGAHIPGRSSTVLHRCNVSLRCCHYSL